MPHHDHTHRVVRRREVIPPHRLPFLVPTTTQDTFIPSLVARGPHSSGTPANQGPKPTSTLTTTVLPVVLGAGCVAHYPQRLKSETNDRKLTPYQCPCYLRHRGPNFSAPKTRQEAHAGRCQ